MNALKQSSTTLEVGAKLHVPLFEDPCQSIGRGLNIHCKKKPKWRRGEQFRLAAGPAQAAFLELQNEVARLLEDHCTEQPAKKRFACTAYMIGLQLETASPVLTFVCKSAKFAEEASKIVEKSGMLKKLPGFSTALMDVLPTGDLVLLAYNNTQLQNSGSQVETQLSSESTSQTRGSDTFPRLPPRTDNWSFQSDHGLTKVFFDPRQEVRSTGMPLYIEGFNAASRKTTGNAFAFGTGYAYLTVAHHLMSAIPCDEEMMTGTARLGTVTQIMLNSSLAKTTQRSMQIMPRNTIICSATSSNPRSRKTGLLFAFSTLSYEGRLTQDVDPTNPLWDPSVHYHPVALPASRSTPRMARWKVSFTV